MTGKKGKRKKAEGPKNLDRYLHKPNSYQFYKINISDIYIYLCSN